MTTPHLPASRPARLAYDDPATMSEMLTDCAAAGRNLRLDPAARIARAAARPAPSIRFDDFGEVRKRDIEVSEAAARLAGALHLHLD